MGLAKKRMMEQDERGYRIHEDGGNVCATCVSDYALARLVEAEATEIRCDFCGSESPQPIAVDVEIVLDHIGESIASEYDDAVNELPWDEGAYVGTTYTIDDVLGDEDWEPQEAFYDLVRRAFSDAQYCQRDPFVLSEFEALHLGWRDFRRTVISEARFTFALVPEGDDEEPGHPVLRGGAMLRMLGDLINEYRLYRVLEAGEDWLRVRPLKKSEPDYTTAKDLGSPPSHKAQPNRMSPAGIPMFYASKDGHTSVKEALGASKAGTDQDGMVATFGTTRPGLVVDLTEIPQPPSLFDEARRAQRARIGFLNGFARDVSQPLRKEDEQQTEYVPTQIVCEYLRHRWRTPDGRRPAGLMFRSASHGETLNVVYFVGPEGCVEPTADSDSAEFQLRLKQARRVAR